MKSPSSNSNLPSSTASAVSPFTRRRFLKTSGVAAAGLSLAGLAGAGEKSQKPVFCTFTKPYQELTYDELADTIAGLGFDGIEATVRDGGHVLPERVEDDLPKLVEALKKRGLEITVMATDINRVDPLTEKVLRTGVALGVPRYRMSYYSYDLKQPLSDQLESFKAPLAELVALNREIGIQALYQNHSGAKYCGAALWDLYYLMRDHPKELFASAYDIGHALVEGGKCWEQHLALMLPHIEILYVKGPAYRDNKIDFGTLAESALDARKLFGTLEKAGFAGPYNLHVEYHMSPADTRLKNTLAATPGDFATLKQWIAEA